MAIHHSIDFGFLLQPQDYFYYCSVSCHVALFLFLSIVWLSTRCNEGRSKEKVENNNFLYYKLTHLSSLSLGLFYLFFSVFTYFFSYSGFLIQLDLGVRTISWFLFFCYMQFEFGRLREEKFPVLLRVWFPVFLIISLYSLLLRLLSLQNHLTVDSHLWVFDFGSLLAGLLLSYAGFFGKRRNEGDDSLLQEPLLNGSCNSIGTGNSTSSDSKNTSLFTNAGFFSIFTFSWISPLLSVGHKKTLDLEDIPTVDESDSINGVLPIFKTKLESQIGANGRVTPFKLAKALVFTCWGQVVLTAIYALVYNLSTYVGPYLIDYFVQYLNGTQRSPKKGYLLVLAFIVGKIFECLSMRHSSFRLQQAGVRVQAALVGTIYEKGLTLSSRSRQSRTSGEMINIMSVDANRVSCFSWYMHDLWLVPIQISLALIILYSCVGLASVSALAATIVIMLANLPLSRMLEKFEEKMMEAKDVRMKAMSEVLRNMRILKLQGWEMKFLQKIINQRKNEASWIKKFMYVNAGITFLFSGTPTFVAVVTFGTCILLGIPLSSGKVLSALATFRVLQEPIYNLSDTVSMIIQTKVSLNRISSFLCLEDLPDNVVHRAPKGSTNVAVEVQSGTFSWDSGSEEPTLKDLNFRVMQGMRVAVCGTVGSGKSSLLSCILGEMPKLSGEVKLCGSVAYVSQLTWIQSAKIQDNILFGTEMDMDRYDKVLEACSLKKDLEILPHGDQTMIGERGINLSGGQKQRIQIARALYQDADIFLFDDPFSAVDAHTGSHLFKECLLRLLASKTVIYVTHQVEFLPAADLILVMKEGKIAQAGKYQEILESGKEFMELVSAHKDALSALDSFSRMEDSSSSNLEIENKKTQIDTSSEEANPNIPKGQLVTEEEREKGKVGFWVYWKYITLAYKGALVPLVLLAQISFQVLQIASNYWMAWAAPVSEDVTPPVSSLTLIYVFVALALGSSLLILARALLLVTAGYKTATILFDKMHLSIFRAPMSFLDSTPSGRILNRASTDQIEVDIIIPWQIGSYAFALIQLFGIIAVMSQVVWQVFVVFIPMIALCLWYQRYYIETARELARLVGVCEAPIIQHFSESLTGSTTIRSFGKESGFKWRNGKLVDDYSQPKFYNEGAMGWLCFRLDIISSLTFAFSLVFLVTIPAGVIDPGLAGLAVTYGLSLNMLQTLVVWNLCNLETEIISVERILQYTNIPSEPPLSTPKDLSLDNSWPAQGDIMLKNLQVRYGPQLPFVLRGLTCTFPGGKKTGIVGRTGSGKSTLIQALFRIVDPTVGRILIDNVDICTIGLHELRSRLSIIPQDPTMFEGTIRNNLDPLEEYTDAQIWEALDSCQLGDEIRKKELKLDSPVTESGENWSVGQRQLVCLGRVILKKSKILVLDEATASVDTATDSLIQKTLRQQFSDSTVITIAHRITSVLDSDMVLLLDNGVVVEHNTPAKLLEDKSSLFSQLVLEYTMR
ncbi:ABC transporter C family member 3-like isoform X1 [Carex rostrata]